MSFDEKADIYSPANVASPIAMGRALRRRRTEMGKTMRQVAEEVGLSEGFISQVERGLSIPSLISLSNLASTLETSVGALLAQVPQRAHPMVSHAAERPDYSLDKEECAVMQRAFSEARINSCITHMPPGYVSELRRHEGEDFHFVIEGDMLYEVGGNEYVLRAGDTLHFPASLPHRVRNIGASPARELRLGTTPILPDG